MSSRRQRITPTTEQKFGDVATIGVSKSSARLDHIHGTPDSADVLVAAPAETGVTIAVLHHAAEDKSAIVDSDEISGQDSESSFALMRTTWSSVKAFLVAYFDTLYAPLTSPVFTTPIRLKGYTVGTLPTGTQGDMAFVTDALAPTFLAAIVGGGTVVTPVFFDGSSWVSY